MPSTEYIHPRLLLRSIPWMRSKISLKEFQNMTGIANKLVLNELLTFFHNNKIGFLSLNTEGILSFSQTDKVKACMLTMRLGPYIQECSDLLTWKDFEYFTSELLTFFGYNTQVNFNLIRPRAQIDVLGIRNEFAISVDCKHWKYNNTSSLRSFAQKQAYRTYRLLEYNPKLKKGMPMIITLNAFDVGFIDGVPVVPIVKLDSFLNHLQDYNDKIVIIDRSLIR